MSKNNGYDPDVYFENFVGHLFRRLGCRTASQPQINFRRSDYLAATPLGDEFYVEATVLWPEQFSRRRPTEEDVCKKLREMCKVPWLYWFTATASGELYQNLPKKKLNPIKEWIEGLPTDYPKTESMDISFPSGKPPRHESTPSTVWDIVINARPRSGSFRGNPDLLLTGFGRGGSIDSVSPFLSTARAKVKQHRTVNKPVVLAINDLADFPLAKIDVSVVLFGWEQNAETGLSRITPPHGHRRPRSLWGNKENSTISAVLLFRGLRPGYEQSANVCLYENPWARHPVSGWLKETFPHSYVVEKEGIHYLFWPAEERLPSVFAYA